MRQTAACCFFLFLLLLTGPGLAGDEVLIETSGQPWPRAALDATSRHPLDPSSTGLVPRKLDQPVAGVWFVPHYRVDTTGFSDTTLFAIRNEDDVGTGAAAVAVEYFDEEFAPGPTQMFAIPPKAVATVNVRDVAGLPTDGVGIARGVIRITPSASHPISVDAFQLDVSQDFATGSLGFAFPGDFCTDWQLRFLDFGTGEGSVATFLVNLPLGSAPTDPPTVTGDVYNEAGGFLNSFTIRTDHVSFEVDVADLVQGGERFGSIELTLNTLLTPRGVVTVRHRAGGRFSVGEKAVCRDGL